MGSRVVTGKRGIYLRSGLSPKIQATPLLFFGRLGAEQEGRAGAVAEVQDWFSFTHRVMFANLGLSGPA